MRLHNSTIKIKTKICVNCGKPCVWFSKKRCKDCARIEDTLANDEKEDEQDESLQNLIADLDFIFSRYIRLKYADKNGKVKCFTSDKEMRWQEAQNGHFISRSNLATRWMEENCRPQSEYDNCHLHGNLEIFKERLEKEKPGITSWLLEQSREVVRPTRDELKHLITNYRHRVKVFEKKLKQ